MTPSADGPDISRWNPVGDWDLIPQYRLFMQKASGRSILELHEYTDPTFHANWVQMRRRGFEFRGCYHWMRSDYSMARQVDHLAGLLDVHGGLQPGEFVMLDWEWTRGAPIITVDQVEEWLTLAEERWPGRIIVYSGEYVSGFQAWRAANPRYPLWFANYNLTHETRNGWLRAPHFGADVWQWTSSYPIPGVNDPTCDMNHVLRWETLAAITAPGSGGDGMKYPNGYGTQLVTLAEMKARHGAKMHPEFARRFFAYMAHKGGVMGVGGGWRSVQPDRLGFAPDGKSFHQDQRFSSGFVGYAAVDLVVGVAGRPHRAPTWAETADASIFGLHTFVKGEPWHIQVASMRGWQSWVDAGRPDPPRLTLPGDFVPPPPPPPPPPPLSKDVDMIALRHVQPGSADGEFVGMIYTGTHLAHVVDGYAWWVSASAGVPEVTVNAVQLDGVIKSSLTTTPPPSELPDAMKAAWSARRA